MNKTLIIIQHFLNVSFKNKAFTVLYAIWLLLILFSAYTGYKTYASQNEIRKEFQHQARQSWVNNPDKHPHRMAHFGSFAFRLKHPLSMYEYGLESYTGNAVFLEAHKQNTINFSEASFSTGLLRFGEISLSFLVRVLLPLILFFLGFAVISQLKENGTLKMLLIQCGSFRTIIWGNSIGLFLVSLIFITPLLLAVGIQLLLLPAFTEPILLHTAILLTAAVIYLWIVSVVAVCISALSNSSRASLLKLLGIWLLMVIVLPKTLQAIGSYIHPASGKIEFETAVGKAILTVGDSHNPNDPHFKFLKDSVLKANGVESTDDLPFNFSGFQMREGERLSTEIYAHHLQGLFDLYQRQNNISYLAAYIDPFLAVKNVNMAFSGTDLMSYRHFQQEAEAYRYKLAQTMNQLQIDNISNKKTGQNEKPQTIEKHHWEDFDDFAYKQPSLGNIIAEQRNAIVAILLWLLISFSFILYSSKMAKAI